MQHSTHMIQEYELLIMPGLGDSGPKHWQHFWLHLYPHSTKLIQDNWEQPLLNDWLNNMHQTVESINKPIIAVAHSLAVSLLLHYIQTYSQSKIIGALLVAPADVNSPLHTPPETHNFAPIPTITLPFPSIVVASENDPYMDFNSAQHYAKSWGSQLVSMGNLGHINSACDLGVWPEGQKILADLIRHI